MPYGAGTYGKQVGRPSNNQKDMGKSPLKNAISNQVASKKGNPRANIQTTPRQSARQVSKV